MEEGEGGGRRGGGRRGLQGDRTREGATWGATQQPCIAKKVSDLPGESTKIRGVLHEESL